MPAIEDVRYRKVSCVRLFCRKRGNEQTPLLSIFEAVRLQLHGAIYRPDSFVLMLRYCANLKAIRYESTTLNGIVADKSHRVIVA